MNPETISLLISSIEKCNNNDDLKDIIQTTTNIYTNVANKINLTTKPKFRHQEKSKQNKKRDKKGSKPWYNNDCRILKRNLNYLNKAINRDPTNTYKRALYYKNLKRYKKTLKLKRRRYEEQIMEKMENLYNENKNEFWKLLKSMRGQLKREDLTQVDNFIEHFKTLFNNKEANSTPQEENINTKSNSSITNQHFESLNKTIDEKEVRFTISNLKHKKSPGYDRISNEMLKCTNTQGIKLLAKLFNKILKTGNFPQEWNYGLIKLIHKGNDIYDPNNYRGITLNSCLGKLFCTVLYNRLAPILERENIYCKEQGGFRKKHRTTDHIFLLRKFIREYTMQNKILYTCFVDFQKAFDSVWRKALIQKLEQTGINGHFLQIIKSIYETTTNSLIFQELLSPKFTSNTGVKQGDALSTILFNLYINDLPNIFKSDNSDPISIENTQINCLKYADDLIIMSTSKNGLQHCLNELDLYCDKWKLQINTKKTKVVLFNRQGSLIKKHKFHFKQKDIEIVREYKYLGFIFACSCSTTTGITNLINQAKKAWFTIRLYLSSSKNKKIETYLKLYDTQIKPILLYACEAWADSIKHLNTENLLRKNKLEIFQISIFKQILGVSRKTTNMSTLFELGRYPLNINIQYQAIKYYMRFPTLNKDRLLYEAYENDIKLNSTGEQNTFKTYIINILNNLGLSYIWRNKQDENDELQEIKNNMILTRLTDIFSQSIFDHINNTKSGKLKFLSTVKETYGMENYLKIKNYQNRRALTKLRTSSHRLAIETGRWVNAKREERTCKQCNENKIEDENHLLFDCKAYTEKRLTTFQFIQSQIGIDLSCEIRRTDNLKILFSSNNINTMNALGKFVKQSFEKRQATS